MVAREIKVCHLSPTYFAPESILGGGERFAEELARVMSRWVAVKFVAFGPEERRETQVAGFERVILKSWSNNPMLPLSPVLLSELAGFEVIHCHQLNVLSTFVAAVAGRPLGAKVFASDLGGGGWTPGYQINIHRFLSGELPISRYAARSLEARHLPHRVIFGGVDLARYTCRAEWKHNGTVVFLGRLLPHKGIHFLVEGLPPGTKLEVIGTEADPAYRERLETLARGKEVSFRSGLSDTEVREFLRSAMALVHPTPVDEHGSAGVAELFGLALVEAMACGCPVIASDAASLPEIVRHEREGLLVPPNQPAAIGAAITRLAQDPALWRQLAANARGRVERDFTWEHVARRCLAAYEELGA